jgi:hypothetical protein
MNATSSSLPHAPKPGRFGEAMLRLVEAHARELREAFVRAVNARRDAANWLRLEDVCAQMLERRRKKIAGTGAAHEPVWLLPDAKGERAFEDLLNRLAGGEPAEVYVKAADELLHNTAHWTFVFDTPTAAYWRHASLVWLSLWHAAQAPDVTASQAAVCLGLTVKRKANPEPAPSGKRERTLPGKLSQLTALGMSIWKRRARSR